MELSWGARSPECYPKDREDAGRDRHEQCHPFQSRQVARHLFPGHRPWRTNDLLALIRAQPPARIPSACSAASLEPSPLPLARSSLSLRMGINLFSTLVAGCALLAPVQAQGRRVLPDISEVPRNSTPSFATRYMVEFSDSGSSRFRKRDGSPVGSASLPCPRPS